MTKGSFHNYNAELVNLLAFLIGALIVVLGLLCETSYGTFGIIMISIGSSIIASSIIVFISSRYQIKKNITQELIEHWGLIGIFKTRAGMNQRADATLTKLRNELDMVAFGLKSFRNVQGGLIERKVKRGLKIRILTMNPNSQIVKQREIDEGEVAGQIKKTILDLENWIIKLKKMSPDPQNIQLKFYDNLPLQSYYRQDSYIYTGPYLYGKPSQQTISFEYRANSHGYDYWDTYFNVVWNDPEFAKKDYNELKKLTV